MTLLKTLKIQLEISMINEFWRNIYGRFYAILSKIPREFSEKKITFAFILSAEVTMSL